MRPGRSVPREERAARASRPQARPERPSGDPDPFHATTNDPGGAVIAAVLATILRTVSATWRTEAADLRAIDDVLAGDRPVLVTFLHGDYAPLFPLMRGREAHVLVAPSSRGGVIAGLCRRFGYVPIAGGPGALQRLAHAAERGRTLAVAVDGPHGPRGTIHAGLLHVACEHGYLILPLGSASRPAWTARRWDHWSVPLPFARVAVRVGDPIIATPSRAGDAGLERLAATVRDAILGVQAGARRSLGLPDWS